MIFTFSSLSWLMILSRLARERFGCNCFCNHVLKPFRVGDPCFDSQNLTYCGQSGCFSASSKLKTKTDDDDCPLALCAAAVSRVRACVRVSSSFFRFF